MQDLVFESMRLAALTATKRKDHDFLLAVFDYHKGDCPGLSSPQQFRDALAAVAAPCIPVNMSEASQHFSRFAVTNHPFLTFDEFKRAVEQSDTLEAWLDEDATLKLGCLAPALHAAIQAHQVSNPQEPKESVTDAALAPLLTLIDIEEDTLVAAVDASVEAIQQLLLSRQLSLRRILQSRSRAQQKRSEFECLQMQVGKIHDFYEGLQRCVGSPGLLFFKCMKEEHCLKSGFDAKFNSGNPYNIDTQPHLEWKYVVPDVSGQRLHCPPIPSPSHDGTPGIPSTRDIKSPHALLDLDVAREAGLSLEEIIAVILYSGPMFVVYNCILRRSSQPPNLYQQLVSCNNLFTTTIFVLGSALQKLSRCTYIPNGTPLFRGLGGQGKFSLELPDSFYACDNNGCSGYTDFGFQSWTADVTTALQYSGVFQNKPSACMLEMQVSSIDRGADISMFSQFPGEKEYTFVPCSFVQRSGEPRAQLVANAHQFGYVSVVSVRINVNLKIETVEDLLEKKKTAHLTSFWMLREETRTKQVAIVQDAQVNLPEAQAVSDYILKQVDDIIKLHQSFSVKEYADDHRYSHYVSHMMQSLRWSKEKLLLWIETARDDSSNDSIKTLSIAESHRLWQAFLHKRFLGSAVGSIQRKTTAIQLLQSRELMISDVAEDAGDDVPLVVQAAAQNWSDSDVECLVAATDVRMRAGWTPVMAAAANGHADILEGLLSHCDVNECDEFGVFALFLASTYGHSSCVDIILRQPTTHVNKLNGLGFTSLDVAHANGHSHCVELLKQHELKLTRRSYDLSLRVTELQDITLQLLQHFVRDSDITGITNILKKGANVDTSNSFDQSIVNFASGRGAVAAVAVLLAFTANVNKCDKDEAAGAVLSILELAVAGETAAIEACVRNGADIHMVDKDGLSALHFAALHGHKSCVQTLVKLGANINTRASTHSYHHSRMHTPLHCAAFSGHLGCIEALAELGADMNICNLNGESAIRSAYSGLKGKAASLLLTCIDTLTRLGTDVNLRSIRGWTALYDPTSYALVSQVSPEVEQETPLDQRMGCNISCVRMLLDKKADVNLCDGAGMSPLQRSREKRFRDIETMLLAAGAELSIFDCAKTGDLVAANRFFCEGSATSGQSLNQTTLCYATITPLDIAVKHGHAEFVVALEEAGAKPGLFAAAAAGNASSIDDLIGSRVDVNTSDVMGESALHLAVRHCHESSHHAVIRALVRSNANINARSRLINTPLCLALCLQKAAAQHLLRSLGAKMTVFEAARNGDAAAIETFVAEGGDVNMRDECSRQSETALHVAAQCAKLNCVTALLERKADANACDSDGKSPLQWVNDSFAKTNEIARSRKEPNYQECLDICRSGVFESIIQSLKVAGASVSTQEKKQLSTLTVAHATAVEVFKHRGSVTMSRHRGSGCVNPDYTLQFHNFNTFVADVQLSGGCFYFEIHILRGHVSQFGFCTAGFEARNDSKGEGVGDDDKSWAVDGYRRQKWHGNKESPYGGPWSNNDVIGFAIDMRQAGAAVMSVSVNGSFKPPNGVAFEGISAPYLSPALTASGHGPSDPSVPEWNVRPEQYRVNFGERTFDFAPPNDASYMSIHTFNLLRQRR